MTPSVRRVGVNLLWLVPGEVGGSEEYTIRLLEALADQPDSGVEVHLYVNRRFNDAHSELAQRFTTHVAPVSGTSRITRVVAESTWLAIRARRDGCTLLHHAGGTMPSVRTTPGIITVHDLQPLANPERFGIVKRTYIRLVAPRSIRRARAVVCLSEFVANDVVSRVGVGLDVIRFVPCGIADPGPSSDSERREELLESLGLSGAAFMLYPAITYPHKNHVTLIAAMAQLAPSRPDLRLVLTGGAGSSDQLVQATIDAYGQSSTVVRTGRLPESDLDLLYRSATLMAFPSLYEGFGVPILEAMSRGCPIVASGAGALPEVLGDAGELVDPTNVAEWVEVLGGLLDDPARRTVLSRRGIDRAARFSWSVSADALLDVYRETR